MSWSSLQLRAGTGVTTGTSATATFTSAVTANSLLVAVVERSAAAFTNVPVVQSVTDNKGNKWKQAAEGIVDTQNNRGLDVWYCDRSIGGPAPTVTAQLAGFPSNAINGLIVSIFEYSCGVACYEALESVGLAAVDATAVTVTTNDSCSAHDLLLSVVVGNASAYTAPAGYTSRVNNTTFGVSIADNTDSGATVVAGSAAWTGMTGMTEGYGAVLAFAQGGVRTSVQSRCEQMNYLAPALSGAPATTVALSQRYPVNLVPGATGIAVVTPDQDRNVLSVTDDQGNVWSQVGDMGNDTIGGIHTSIWACKGIWAAAPTLTGTLDVATAGGDCAWTLLEYANLSGIVPNASGSSLMYSATAVPSVFTTTPVQSSDLVLAYINGEVGYFDGLHYSAGWRNRLSDSNGSGGLVERLQPSATVQSLTWGYNSSQGGSTFITSFGSAVPVPPPPTPPIPTTDTNGVVNGPIPAGAPHFKIPFTIDTDGTAETVQQDTSADVVQCVAVLFGTDPGTRLMLPAYGILDPTFAGINQVRVQAAVKQWEPRATVAMQYTPDGIEQVAVTVAGGNP